MGALTIPTTPGVPFYTQKTRLDGVDYILGFRYSQREDRWYFSIYDSEEKPILLGLKLVTNWPLLQAYRFNPLVPPGEIMAQSLTTDESPPGLDELGPNRRVQLIYFEKGTLPETSPTQKVGATIYVAARVTPLAGYPGDAAYASALATACAGLRAPNSSVSTSDVFAAASTISSATVTGLAIATSPISPIPTTVVANTIAISATSAGIAVSVVSA